jgi:hypothetical protein
MELPGKGKEQERWVPAAILPRKDQERRVLAAKLPRKEQERWVSAARLSRKEQERWVPVAKLLQCLGGRVTHSSGWGGGVGGGGWGVFIGTLRMV